MSCYRYVNIISIQLRGKIAKKCPDLNMGQNVLLDEPFTSRFWNISINMEIFRVVSLSHKRNTYEGRSRSHCGLLIPIPYVQC